MQFSPTYIKIQWAMTLFVMFIDIFWIKFGSFEFFGEYQSIKKCLFITAVFYLPYLFYKYFRPNFRIMTALISVYFMIIYTYFIFVFSYLVYTMDFPIIDSSLSQFDTFFGYHAKSLIYWFKDHEWLYVVLTHIYNSYYYQGPFILFYFSFFSNMLVLQRFVVLFMIGPFVSLVIAGLLPSGGPYYLEHFQYADYNVTALKHFLQLRNQIVDIRSGVGLILFPSYHAVLALFYIYAFRNEKKYIFIPILILNILILFSCLTNGEHYLADVVGGIGVFFLVIGIEQLIYMTVKKYGTIEDFDPLKV